MVYYLSDVARILPEPRIIFKPSVGDNNKFLLAAELGSLMLKNERVLVCSDDSAFDGVISYWRSKGKEVYRIPNDIPIELQSFDITMIRGNKAHCRALAAFHRGKDMIKLLRAVKGYDVNDLLDCYLDCLSLEDEETLQLAMREYIINVDESAFRSAVAELVEAYGGDIISSNIGRIADRWGLGLDA